MGDLRSLAVWQPPRECSYHSSEGCHNLMPNLPDMESERCYWWDTYQKLWIASTFIRLTGRFRISKHLEYINEPALWSYSYLVIEEFVYLVNLWGVGKSTTRLSLVIYLLIYHPLFTHDILSIRLLSSLDLPVRLCIIPSVYIHPPTNIANQPVNRNSWYDITITPFGRATCSIFLPL